AAGATVTSSNSDTAWNTVTSPWYPSGRSGPTASCRLILAGTRTVTLVTITEAYFVPSSRLRVGWTGPCRGDARGPSTEDAATLGLGAASGSAVGGSAGRRSAAGSLRDAGEIGDGQGLAAGA